MTIGGQLQKIFDREGWTQEVAAQKLGLSRQTINKLVNDQQRITPDVALRLERVFGDPAPYWLRKQIDDDLVRAKAKRKRRTR